MRTDPILLDPIGEAGGTNLYSYVTLDPVNWVDPLGLRADVNGFSPIVDPSLYRTSEQMPNNPKVIMVTGHGTPWGGTIFTPEDLAKKNKGIG